MSTSGSDFPPSPAGAWGHFLVRLSFVAGLAAVVLFAWPVVCRLGEQAGSDRAAATERITPAPSAARPRQASVVDAETGPGERVGAIPTPLPGAEEVKPTLAPGRVDGADTPPPLPDDLPPRGVQHRPAHMDRADTPPPVPDGLPPDRVVEQRLRASEADLLAQLRAVAEVRLLSDADVRKVRQDEKAAQEQLLKPARAKLEAAGKRVTAAYARVAELGSAITRNPRDESLRTAHRGAAASAEQAARAYNDVAATYQRIASRDGRDRERITYDTNLRLHETLKETAVRAGLAIQSGPNCQLPNLTAARVAWLSKGLRDNGFVSLPGSPGGGAGSFNADEAARARTEKLRAWCDQHRWEETSGAVPTLTQMLQIEDEAKRLVLVYELARISTAEATAQLAVRAVVDLSPAVRKAAVAGLAQRPWGQYGSVLLRGLRYPWPPAADHAALALRTLRPPEAVAPLVDLLDLPSPSEPVRDDTTGRYAVSELVRLNHLRNCLLCHAPSADKKDGLVRGLVPTPGEALPVLYYESQGGSFVQADVTYLHQDFSVILIDGDTGPWPREQRYDFVTRRRTLSPGEVPEPFASPGRSPQRDAVLYALRGLTGKDGGDSIARWRELLGPVAGRPKGEKERAALEKTVVSLTDTNRPR